jgi:hypothetical protein
VTTERFFLVSSYKADKTLCDQMVFLAPMGMVPSFSWGTQSPDSNTLGCTMTILEISAADYGKFVIEHGSTRREIADPGKKPKLN